MNKKIYISLFLIIIPAFISCADSDASQKMLKEAQLNASTATNNFDLTMKRNLQWKKSHPEGTTPAMWYKTIKALEALGEAKTAFKAARYAAGAGRRY